MLFSCNINKELEYDVAVIGGPCREAIERTVALGGAIIPEA